MALSADAKSAKWADAVGMKLRHGCISVAGLRHESASGTVVIAFNLDGTETLKIPTRKGARATHRDDGLWIE